MIDFCRFAAGFFRRDAAESMTRAVALLVAVASAIVAVGALGFAMKHAATPQAAELIEELRTIVWTGWVGTALVLLTRPRPQKAPPGSQDDPGGPNDG